MKAKGSNVLPSGRPLPCFDGKRKAAVLQRDWKKRLSAYLDDKALNQSGARNRIIEIVLAKEGHFSVAELVKRVQEAHPQIGVATVYRSIPVLLGFGLIRETLSGETGQMIYEVADEHHHDHIVCVDCQKIFEFHDSRIESAQEKISQKMGFKPASHRHVIYARCEFRTPDGPE